MKNKDVLKVAVEIESILWDDIIDDQKLLESIGIKATSMSEEEKFNLIEENQSQIEDLIPDFMNIDIYPTHELYSCYLDFSETDPTDEYKFYFLLESIISERFGVDMRITYSKDWYDNITYCFELR